MAANAAMHIYDFITDDFQHRLKQRASKGRRRFEDVLETYKSLFFRELAQAGADGPARHLPKSLSTNPAARGWLAGFQRMLAEESPVLAALFDELIQGYQLFIRSRHHLAALRYQDVLDKYGFLDADNVPPGIFFRGVRVRPDADACDKKLYYHTPFHQRHLLDHGRFSFSGIPILYLGSSVADVYFEMGEHDLNAADIALASFVFKGGPEDSGKPVYTVTNQLQGLADDALGSLQNPQASGGAAHARYRTRLATHARKFIITQLCTFPQQHEQCSFYQEYVIPQLFTEALSLHRYAGVVFPSTRFHGHRVKTKPGQRGIRYRDNLAMFSTYHHARNYDETLLKSFAIDTLGLDPANIAPVTQLLEQQSVLQDTLARQPQTASRRRHTGLALEIAGKTNFYGGLRIDGTPYLHTTAGRIELACLNAHLSRLAAGKPRV